MAVEKLDMAAEEVIVVNWGIDEVASVDELGEVDVGAIVQVEQVPVKVESEDEELVIGEQVEQVDVGISVLPVQVVVPPPHVVVDVTGLIFSEKLVVTDAVEVPVCVELGELELAVDDATELELVEEDVTELEGATDELEDVGAIETDELEGVDEVERDELELVLVLAEVED